MVKTLNIPFDDDDFKDLSSIKEIKKWSWQDFILTCAYTWQASTEIVKERKWHDLIKKRKKQ